MAFRINPFTGILDYVMGIGDPAYSGTSGSVLFVDSSGNLAQNNTNFFWDNTNKELRLGGIGTQNAKFLSESEAADDYNLYLRTLAAGYNTSYGTYRGIYQNIVGANIGTPISHIYGQVTDLSNANTISSASFGDGWGTTGNYLNISVSGDVTSATSFLDETNIGVDSQIVRSGTVTTSDYNIVNAGFLARLQGSFTYNNALGTYVEVNYGLSSEISGTATVVNGIYSSLNYGVYVRVPRVSPGNSNNYGVFIDAVLGATSNWGFYNNSGANSYLNGNLGISPGALTPTSLLEVVETNSSNLQAVSIQGYSDGGFCTKGVLEIKNENAQRMVLLAGSNLAGAGDYGEINFYGTATVAQNLYSFGDFNWVNSSGEATGDLRMGTMRVYRDGGAYQGTWAVVLRTNSGGFISAQTQKYSGQFGLNGVTSPTAWLHLPAGTASASQAPLKFTTGTLQTTGEAGAMEFASSRLTFVPSGTTRKRIALTNDVTPTNGQIPIGNGTDFTTASLTAGSNITITPGAGSITIAASGGAGATWTETEIDFGTTPQWSKTFTVTDAGVSGSSKIVLCPSGNVGTSRVGNDQEWDNLILAGLAGSGSFILTAIAFPGPVVGKRKVFYSIA